MHLVLGIPARLRRRCKLIETERRAARRPRPPPCPACASPAAQAPGGLARDRAAPRARAGSRGSVAASGGRGDHARQLQALLPLPAAIPGASLPRHTLMIDLAAACRVLTRHRQRAFRSAAQAPHSSWAPAQPRRANRTAARERAWAACGAPPPLDSLVPLVHEGGGMLTSLAPFTRGGFVHQPLTHAAALSGERDAAGPTAVPVPAPGRVGRRHARRAVRCPPPPPPQGALVHSASLGLGRRPAISRSHALLACATGAASFVRLAQAAVRAGVRARAAGRRGARVGRAAARVPAGGGAGVPGHAQARAGPGEGGGGVFAPEGLKATWPRAGKGWTPGEGRVEGRTGGRSCVQEPGSRVHARRRSPAAATVPSPGVLLCCVQAARFSCAAGLQIERRGERRRRQKTPCAFARAFASAAAGAELAGDAERRREAAPGGGAAAVPPAAVRRPGRVHQRRERRRGAAPLPGASAKWAEGSGRAA